MNIYLQFTLEIIAKFINYISQDIDEFNSSSIKNSSTNNNSIENYFIVDDECITYILNKLLFYKKFPRNDTDIMLNLKHNKFTYKMANDYLLPFLSPSLQHFIKSQTFDLNILSLNSYEEIISLNEYLTILLKQNYKIEDIIPQAKNENYIDYGFEFEYQNNITQSILFILKSITSWLDFSMIEIKDVEFVENCIIASNSIQNYQLFTLNEDDLKNYNIIKPVLESIIIKNDLYITNEACNQLCKLWIYLNNQPLSLRLLCFNQ